MLAFVRSGVGTALLPDVVARHHDDLHRIDEAPVVPGRKLWLLGA